ncbi:N-acetyltransferase [Paenibacillus sp. H1-7]|uniref:GNAT family N-acetyltransferase n=1 Tax=Paenibacillus sp. H1-7 TaxID=2282849 RepID=UPI001EF94D36|nr:GNAT family N-acetyltransferase [Paenibacillus sp. H1-7]ULL13964.1 N-acetyltransferase [Paenibacillus sp. H1-7]
MNLNPSSGSANQAFTIECSDLILREFGPDDLDDIHELTWQPEIYEWLPGWNVPKEKRANWLLNYELKENRQFLKAVSDGGDVGQLCLRLGMIDKATGRFVGWCCTRIKPELPPPNREIMYAVSRDYRSRGYSTQAAKGLTAFLFSSTNVDVLNAIALVHNVPSNKVIRKCGFAYHQNIEIDNQTYHAYKLTKTDWEKSVVGR